MIFRNFPIIGPFLASSSESRWTVMWEVIITLAFATAPFWLPGFFLSFLEKNAGKSYLDLTMMTFSRGELLIAASGLLGPVVLSLSDHPRHAEASWTRKILLIAAFLMGFASVGAYGFLRSYVYADTYFEISQTLVLNASLWMLVIAALIRFGAASYSRFQFEVDALRDGESEFSVSFANRHKGP